MRALSTTIPLLIGSFSVVFNQQPLHADTFTLNFETLTNGTSITDSTPLITQFPGLTFSNATVITAGISLNEFEFPPHSGQNVVFDDGGPISISFASPINTFGAFVTYAEPLTLIAFNSSGAEVGSGISTFSNNEALSGDSGSSPNEFLSLVDAEQFTTVTVAGDLAGTSFTMDDITFTSSVPEPSSAVLLMTMSLAVSIIYLRPKPFITFMSRTKLSILVVSVVAAVGSLVLLAQTQPVSYRGAGVPPIRPKSSDASFVARETPAGAGSSTSQTPATAASPTPHFIGQTALSETSVVAGSSQPIILSANIPDPALITSSVLAVQVLPTGQQQSLGALRDDGQNGDLVANDGIYSIRLSAASFQPGTVILRVSAGFLGSLKRVQSDDLPLTVLPALSMAGWTTVTDAQHLFTLQMPPQWHLSMVETGADPDDPDAMKTVAFQTTAGDIILFISIYTKAGWAQEQQDSALPPQYYGENGTFVFAYGVSQSGPAFDGFTNDQISQQLNQVLASFHIN